VGLISVRTDVVLETLVGSIADAAAARTEEPLDPRVEAALAATPDPRLARLGYLARSVEVERFEPARAAMPWLQGVGFERAAELAAAEPRERPDPDDERAVSWKVPGPGGHVRHYVAARAGGEKRVWLTGFLIHCIGESVDARPGA
jgi:hypothetical protein